MGNEGAQHLLGVKTAARLYYPRHLGHGARPLAYMVDDAKIEYCVIGLVRHRDPRDIADPEASSIAAFREARPCAGDHSRIEIERVDALGAERIQNDLRSDAAATSNLQRDAAYSTSKAQKSLRLDPPLHHGANRVVHQSVLEGIQEHFGLQHLLKRSSQGRDAMPCIVSGPQRLSRTKSDSSGSTTMTHPAPRSR